MAKAVKFNSQAEVDIYNNQYGGNSEAFLRDYPQNGVDVDQGSDIVVPNSPAQISEQKNNQQLKIVQNEEARKKERLDVNSSRLASIFFREQSIGGSRKQQPDMLSEFLGL